MRATTACMCEFSCELTAAVTKVMGKLNEVIRTGYLQLSLTDGNTEGKHIVDFEGVCGKDVGKL